MDEQPEKVNKAGLWCWHWRGWSSPAFPYLEERPWTPLIIFERLCFVAADQNVDDSSIEYQSAKWCVVWGDKQGPWFDDVINLEDVRGTPAYIARQDTPEGSVYRIVKGDACSQAFSNQIRLDQTNDDLTVRLLRPASNETPDRQSITWQNLEEALIS